MVSLLPQTVLVQVHLHNCTSQPNCKATMSAHRWHKERTARPSLPDRAHWECSPHKNCMSHILSLVRVPVPVWVLALVLVWVQVLVLMSVLVSVRLSVLVSALLSVLLSATVWVSELVSVLAWVPLSVLASVLLSATVRVWELVSVLAWVPWVPGWVLVLALVWLAKLRTDTSH